MVVCLAISFINTEAATIYVNAGTGNDTYNGFHSTWTSGTNGPKNTIQAAVSIANNFDTIIIAAGLYKEQVVIDSQLVVMGAGSGADTLFNTVLQAPVTGSGTGISITNGGTSDTSRFIISDIHVRDFSTGLTFASYVTFDNVAAVNNYYGIHKGSGMLKGIHQINNNISQNSHAGIFIGHSADVDGWIIDSCIFIENYHSGIYVFCDNPSTANCRNFTIRNSEFRKNVQKGMYFEKLQDALFENLIIDSCGHNPAYNFNTGLDINLKYNDYSNIVIRNCDFINSGIGGSDAFGCGFIVKGRDDGAIYGANPATLDSVSIENIFVTGCRNGIILGEPGAGNNTPTNVNIEFSYISGNILKGLVSEIISDAEAHNNWWGSTTGPDTSDISMKSSGTINNITFLTSGIDIMPSIPGFQLNKTASFKPIINTLQQAIDVVHDSFTLIVPTGYYSGSTETGKLLTLLPWTNVIIDTLVALYPANLTIIDTGITINGMLELKPQAFFIVEYPAEILLTTASLLKEAPGTRVLGNIHSTMNIDTAWKQYDFNGTGLYLTSENTLSLPGITNIIRRTYPVPHYSPEHLPRVFEIDAQNNQNLNTRLIFTYDTSELDSIMYETALVLSRSSDNGNTWYQSTSWHDIAGKQFQSWLLDSINGLWTAFDSYSSVDELSEKNFTIIYPNPAQSSLTILINKPDVTRINVDLYSISGRLLMEQNISGDNMFNLDLTPFSNGVYLLKVYDGKDVSVERLVIQR